MTTQPDFYGVPLEGVTEQTDVITLTASPSALTKAAVVSYPSLETAGATPTADVITVYDVTTAHALVLGTDYTLTSSGARPETWTYSVTWVSSSPSSASGDTCRVTYRYGTIPDTSYNFGEFQGQPAGTTTTPAGTAFKASNADTEGASASGLGSAAGYGSLADPAMGSQSSSETGAPGSEYAVTETGPGAFGYSGSGSPDTEGVLGGGLPESFTPVVTSFGSAASPAVIDTTAAGGSNLVPSEYSAPPGYRAPSSGVAAANKDTTLTDILGNALNANPLSTDAFYAAQVVDTSYIGAPDKPTSLASQADPFAAAQAGTPCYLSQQGIIPSSVTVTNTSTITAMVLGTDYTLTVAGNGAGTVAYITPVVAAHFANGNNISVAYTWGDPTYWETNPPASVPGAPVITAATAVNRGVKVTWQPPSGTVPVDYYLLQSVPDLGTMYVPATGQPVEYGQPAPSGGAIVGEPSYQADAFTNLIAAALAVPAAPAGTGNTGSGSTLAAGNYKIINTYVNANGETTGSASTTIAVTATDNLVVSSPAAEAGATGWYSYITQAGGSTYARQQAAGSPTAIGTALTLTAPPTSGGASPPVLNTTLPTLSKSGILTPPGQVIVKDVTSAAQSVLASGEVSGGEADPLQADASVLEYGYDYTITQVGIGPWTQYQVALVPGSVNAAAGDTIIVEYWYGADPSSVTAVFTQGLLQNTPVIYKPDGTTPYNHGYAFEAAAGNHIGLGPFSALSAYAVPLNYGQPQPGSEGSINVGTGALDPANAVNPIYRPDGTIKSGTGLGG
ncbi:MAG: hypothetical protein JWM19_971 [Actinomycetia bacterium]|nr:hypothetical protein [Actinomycetes bacterium]